MTTQIPKANKKNTLQQSVKKKTTSPLWNHARINKIQSPHKNTITLSLIVNRKEIPRIQSRRIPVKEVTKRDSIMMFKGLTKVDKNLTVNKLVAIICQFTKSNTKSRTNLLPLE